MKLLKTSVFVLTLALIAGTAFALNWLKAHQRLGRPGIHAEPVADSVVMNFDLPEHVLDYVSTNQPQDDVVLNFLPKDTSYAKRMYRASDGFEVLGNIILQGADRSSIHKAEYCLAGAGCEMVDKSIVEIPIAGPHPYTLPVSKYRIRREVKLPDGRKALQQGLYMFWFVADGEQTPDYGQHLRWIYRDVVKSGVMQRWAYVSFQAGFGPGEEDVVCERMKQLIAAAVPQFQLPPATTVAEATARP